MATLVLGAAGAAIGGSIGGTILGVSAATIGGFIGSTVGTVVDSWIVSSLAPTQRIEGARLENLQITSSTEGAVIPRLYGRMRIGGNIIWATDFREEVRTTTHGGGGKGGGGPKIETTEHLYYASFAVALCEGPITGIGRIWADGKLMDMTGVTWRWYPGDEVQEADPFIAAKMVAGSTPAYRGTAYVMFEDLPLNGYGNRLPQLSFEVYRTLDDVTGAESMIRSVAIMPTAGGFGLATTPVRSGGAGTTASENIHARAEVTDFIVALDQLQAALPVLEAVTLMIPWFGDDLRTSVCQLRPGVELADLVTTPKPWRVSGIERGDAHLISTHKGRPAFAATPADAAVIEAIRELKARGLKVTLLPVIQMDIPAGNALPDPYSDHAAEIGQPAYPTARALTCAPASRYIGSVDKTPTAAGQVSALFGGLLSASFSVAGNEIAWTGSAGDWTLRRFVLHYAHLAQVAGGVATFLLGAGLIGLTTIRSDATSYPAVAELCALAEDVRAIVGSATAISYAVDWTEYSGHRLEDGSGDVLFHLDPLWAHPDIGFVGINQFAPLSDWRDGRGHLDGVDGWPSTYDQGYLQSNIEGGEAFDWTYATAADREAQTRTPIADPAHGKPWVFRSKDLSSWWSNLHYDRLGGVEAAAPTAWVPRSKPIVFTGFGCPAIHRGTNQPDAQLDRKADGFAVPYFSRGWRDDAIQRAALEALLSYWADPARNPNSPVYGGRMLEMAAATAVGWDARPYPFFPDLTAVWPDGEAWRTGLWLTGRLGAGSLATLVRALCLRAGLPEARVDVSGLTGTVEGYIITALESPRASISTLAKHYGFDAVETEGLIRFVMRDRAPVAALTHDDLVAAREGDRLELTRAQETELPQALKWQVTRSDGDYDTVQVEARRITVDSTRISSESFPLAVPPEEAERRCQRALTEAWTARETAAFQLPPSRLSLDPADVITLEHNGRASACRITSIADANARGLEVLRQEGTSAEIGPGEPRPASVSEAVSLGAPEVVFLDLPQLTDEVPAHRPFVAARATPWPGQLAVYRSPGADGFALLTTIGQPARIGTLAAELFAGPTSRFDMGNALLLDLPEGRLDSVTDLALFGGANALAVESAPGIWEVLQARNAEIVAPGQYQLTHLLRGQRGTEGAMGNPAPVGARVVVLDDSIVPLPISEADIGIPWNWRVGPAARAFTDASYVAESFTPSGIGLRPFSVAHVEQPWRTPRTPGDLTIHWTRRSRALAADSWGGVEVPLVEEREAYEVEILDGATVRRVLRATNTSVVYTATDQTADWGGPLGPVDTLTVRIFQLSAQVGRGAPKTVTLNL